MYCEGDTDSAGVYEVHAHNVDTQQPVTVHCQQLVVATDEVSAARLLRHTHTTRDTVSGQGQVQAPAPALATATAAPEARG